MLIAHQLAPADRSNSTYKRQPLRATTCIKCPPGLFENHANAKPPGLIGIVATFEQCSYRLKRWKTLTITQNLCLQRLRSLRVFCYLNDLIDLSRQWRCAMVKHHIAQFRNFGIVRI